MKEVPLFGPKAAGRVALVDDEDYELVSQYRWYVLQRASGPGRNRTGPYAYSNRWVNGRNVGLFMHTLITGYARTDHVNHDGLDNRRQNLRPATASQNGANQLPQAARSSRFKGVSWDRGKGKWRAEIKVNQITRWLGRFDCEVDAADAYDRAAVELFGEYACLNNARALADPGGDGPPGRASPDTRKAPSAWGPDAHQRGGSARPAYPSGPTVPGGER